MLQSFISKLFKKYLLKKIFSYRCYGENGKRCLFFAIGEGSRNFVVCFLHTSGQIVRFSPSLVTLVVEVIVWMCTRRRLVEGERR